jgi:integrase
VVDTKSRAGRRTIGVPPPLVQALLEHRQAQDAERELAADLWKDGGWIFAQPTGKPVDPRADYGEWRGLLSEANVREARLHDGTNTCRSRY